MLTKAAELATNIIQAKDLRAHFDEATYYQDFGKVARIYELMATEQRRYDFSYPNLNGRVNFVPTSFRNWLHQNWGAQ
jgi:hypothetical protein